MDIQKRRKLIIVFLIVFLVISVCGYFAYKSYSGNKPVKVSAEVKNDKKTKKSDKKEVKNTKKDETQANNKATASTAIKNKATNKKATPKSNKKATFSDKKTSTKPAKKKVWVVDKAAWTETVTKYRQAPVTVEYAQFGDGTQIPFCRTHEDGTVEHLGMNAVNEYWETVDSGWRNGYRTEYEQVPYTETINHPEEGHWEYR